jgi:hypothetical protein
LADGWGADFTEPVVDGFAAVLDDAVLCDFEEDFEEVFPDEPDAEVLSADEPEDAEELVLSRDLPDVSVADLTVFSAADVTDLTGSLPELSACASPVANPSSRKPTINPITNTSRRARRSSVRSGVSGAAVVMAMRSPPCSLRRMVAAPREP